MENQSAFATQTKLDAYVMELRAGSEWDKAYVIEEYVLDHLKSQHSYGLRGV
jgi:hypothetical protein